jgi:hypothetical protein
VVFRFKAEIIFWLERKGKMKVCKYCQKLIDDDSSYCPLCGAEILKNNPYEKEPEPILIQVTPVESPTPQTIYKYIAPPKQTWWLPFFLGWVGSIILLFLDSKKYSKRGGFIWTVINVFFGMINVIDLKGTIQSLTDNFIELEGPVIFTEAGQEIDVAELFQTFGKYLLIFTIAGIVINIGCAVKLYLDLQKNKPGVLPKEDSTPNVTPSV